MNRITRFLAVLLLAACGSSQAPPPNMNDACAIAKDRRAWMRDMERTERKWGVPVPVQMSTIYHESKFEAKARTPVRWVLGVIPMGRRSSAYGFAQAIDGTWDWYRDSTGNRWAKRDRFGDASDFIGWYMDRTEKANGIAKHDARNQYLAYHEGHTGYARGSWRNKSWLVRVADSVADRAAMYDRQLRSCRRR